MSRTNLTCFSCNHTPNPLDWRCMQCGGVLDFAALPEFQATQIRLDDFSIWRYAAMLPVKKQLSLGEGMTPLVETEIDGMRFLAKLDYLNPTGSYKDRGVATMINHMLAHKVREVVEDSSGNAGASVAAYSSAAGIHARIFTPRAGSPTKKALIRALGGDIVEIEGAQAARAQACMRAAKTTPYASHAWNPYFLLGQMTVAWEVWEQMGKRAPDAIICPIGHGGFLMGFARGFQALLSAGLIDRIPRLYGAQTTSCDPIARAWENRSPEPAQVTPAHTVADGIVVDHPVRGREVLRAISESGGAVFRVDDAAILETQQKLIRKGLIVEPTSSVTIAALRQTIAQIGDHAKIVAGLTGNGLKLINQFV